MRQRRVAGPHRKEEEERETASNSSSFLSTFANPALYRQ